MKLTFGRKFLAMVLVMALLTAVVGAALFLEGAAVTGAVLIAYMVLITTMGMMYIGGNVWDTWAKSKFFHSELVDK